MKKVSTYVTNFRQCAFCKHWYDPSNSHIRPIDIRRQLWEYDETAKSYCDLKRIEKRSDGRCLEFEKKI